MVVRSDRTGFFPSNQRRGLHCSFSLSSRQKSIQNVQESRRTRPSPCQMSLMWQGRFPLWKLLWLACSSKWLELALQLVHERELRYERRLSTLETLVQQMIEPSVGSQTPEGSRGACPSDHSSAGGWCPDPAELRARSRVVSLIEYAADGAYVIISPQKGELFFSPDSPEWFEWLASLSSFRFIGQLGRFSAHREVRHGQSSRRWSANLSIHNRNYTCYLGITDNLTISCLEQIAATLQSRAK